MTHTIDTSKLRVHTAAPRGTPIGGIVVIPGLRGRSRWLTRQLARAGYLVYAPSVLDGLGLNAREARVTQNVMDGLAVQPADLTYTVREALATLRSPQFTHRAVSRLRTAVDGVCAAAGIDRVAVIGSGAGGSLAYALAAHDARVRLALAYDSSPPDIDVIEDIKGAAASFYGGSHPGVTESLPEVQAAMRRAGVPFASKAYAGLDHVRLDRRQSADAECDLWQRSLALLCLHLA
ncbi:dienelactone hydrolase family protein [Calidifontibacter terrae]